MSEQWRNKLFFGDNLRILREHIDDESVDLIYLDPPFNSKATYNVLFQEHSGKESAAQIAVFEDTWHWTKESEAMYHELITGSTTPSALANMMQAFRSFLGSSDMMAYITMMAPRLLELHRVLKSTGSLYLHCDPTASHYLKLLLDGIFQPRNFMNEIVWKRTTAHNDPNRYGRVGDRLLFYARSDKKTFNGAGGTYSAEQMQRYKYRDDKGAFRAENLTAPHYSETRTVLWRGTHPGRDRQWRFSTEELSRLWAEGRILLRRDGTPRKDGLKEYLHEMGGPVLQDIWTDIGMGPTAGERLGYPTQKPGALLERIINASSNEGGVVLDPFCGCGTTITVAELLHRRWIGIDVTHLAISLIRHRLHDTFGAELAPYEVIGDPKDLSGAQALAVEDRYQFQWWTVGMVDGRPAQDKKKGKDTGIDGYIYFFDDPREKAKQIIIQVKSGHVGSKDIRDLRGVIEREKAAIGVFITLEEPTRDMNTEAVSSGFYEPEFFKEQKYPKLQILTIEEILAGKKIMYPQAQTGIGTFKKAERKTKKKEEQQGLF